jgi:hypothetical protein
MSSLDRFKQRLRGEIPVKQTKEQPQLGDWLQLVTETVQDVPETNIAEHDITVKAEEMTKAELDAYAAENHGIQLDRRQTKLNMITEFIQKLKEKN